MSENIYLKSLGKQRTMIMITFNRLSVAGAVTKNSGVSGYTSKLGQWVYLQILLLTMGIILIFFHRLYFRLFK